MGQQRPGSIAVLVRNFKAIKHCEKELGTHGACLPGAVGALATDCADLLYMTSGAWYVVYGAWCASCRLSR